LTKIIKISLENVQDDILTYEILNPGEKFPNPRGNTSCCLAGNEIYLFGGGNVEDVYGDFWSWDIEKSIWNEIKPEDRLSWPDVNSKSFRGAKEAVWFCIQSLIAYFCSVVLRKSLKSKTTC
jgi:hypothetical protein